MSNESVNFEDETILLDSSLISKYDLSKKCQLKSFNKIDMYSVKLINCGDYIQVYYYDNVNTRLSDDFKDDIKFKELERKHKLGVLAISDTDDLAKTKYKPDLRSISFQNASRSRFNCQRIAKSNISIWETFITLTFEDNDNLDIEDIPTCNKVFNSWISNVRKKKKDFKYLAVPEIQKKRGEKYGVYAIHYHVLSNIGLNDVPDLIFPQKNWTEKQLKEMTEEQRSKCYDVKYWNKGNVRVDFCYGDMRKITGYISKYMTKDIDDKFFGKKRYFYSQNINKPVTEYLDLSNERDKDYFMSLMQGYKVDYFNTYYDRFDNNIEFIEFKK